jgi:hypothetical protein
MLMGSLSASSRTRIRDLSLGLVMGVLRTEERRPPLEVATNFFCLGRNEC